MLGFLSQIKQIKARKHVTEIFEVKTGTENGGCDNYRVDEWFAEASDLALHVTRCFDSAQKALEERDLDHDSFHYLKTFFNLDPREETNFNDHFDKMKKDLGEVLEALDDDEDTEEDDKPRLFCDSTFAVGESPTSILTGAILTIHGTEKEWDDAALEEGTGKEYPLEIVKGDLREKPIMEAMEKWYKAVFIERKKDRENEEDEAAREALPPLWYPFWVDHLKMYRFDVKGDYCSARGNMGATEDQRQPTIITLCPQNFKSERNKKWYQKFDDIPEVKQQGRSIRTIALPSLTFFHEMFHVALTVEHTPDVTYKLSQIIGSEALDGTENVPNEADKLISQEQSRINPES
ncbi:hypothetical protein ACJ41O_000006 [Fusarium nematophilum]